MFPLAKLCRRLSAIVFSLVAAASLQAQTETKLPPPAVSERTSAPDANAGTAIVNCNTLLTLPICPVEFELETVRLINQIRADSGRSQLIWDYRLFVGARCHSTDMKVNNCFQLDDCDGTIWTSRFSALGYTAIIGQDQGAGFTTPASIVNAWLSDPNTLHRQLLLNPTTKHVGVGYVTGGTYGRYWTVAYGAATTAQALPCSCCDGATGNVDCDGTGSVDIGDLTTLIDNLFIGFTPLCCDEEANCDGDPGNSIDIGDLTSLIDNLFITFSPLPACQ